MSSLTETDPSRRRMTMRPVRVLVVEDENRLASVCGGCSSAIRASRLPVACVAGAEALRIVQESARAGAPVQLLVLDVQTPELDGFGVIAELARDAGKDEKPGNIPAVVFVTAHDEYAIRAFDAHAIDYLLKPFSDERFEAALDRAIRHVRAGDAQALLSEMQGAARPRRRDSRR